MKKSYAPKSQQSRGRSRGGMLLGLFIGLVVGVLAAFGVVWYLNKTPLPFQDKTGRADKAAERPGAGKTPDQLPGKPGDKVGDKPRFEFYKILPGGQEAAPSAPGVTPPAPPPSAAVPPPVRDVPLAPNESFYLQAGAFQKAADADNQKAKLSLLGLDVAVQEVTIAEKGTMYRVRVGPFDRPEEMNRVRNQLAQNGIQATVVKIKNPKN